MPLTEIFGIFRRCNKYIDETTPWTLAKDEAKKDRLATVLYNLTEAITIGASLLESFMPETSEKILAQLNTKKRELDEMDTFGLYLSGNKVTDKPEILFARMDIKEVMAKVEEMRAAAAEAAKPAEEAAEDDGIDLEPKAEITYDDFAKLQFQVGVILSCRGCSRVQEASLLPGSGRKQSAPDHQRHQAFLLPGGDGRQESHGCDQLKTGEIGRSALRGHDFVC